MSKKKTKKKTNGIPKFHNAELQKAVEENYKRLEEWQLCWVYMALQEFEKDRATVSVTMNPNGERTVEFKWMEKKNEDNI